MDSTKYGEQIREGRQPFLTKPGSYRNGSIIDQVDLENLPWERETLGFWLDIPESLLQLFVDREVNPAGTKHPGYFSSVGAYRVCGFPEAIHSAQHAVLNRVQMSGGLLTECKAATKEYKTEKSKRKRPAR